jgi:hypothetical protein
MPLHRLSAQKFVQGHVQPFDRQIAVDTERNEFFDKAANVGMLFRKTPVKPGNFIVLAVGIVVSSLGAPHLVPHQPHRRPGCQQGQIQKILDLAIAQSLHLRVGALTFDTAIPAEILLRPRRDCFLRSLHCACY